MITALKMCSTIPQDAIVIVLPVFARLRGMVESLDLSSLALATLPLHCSVVARFRESEKAVELL